MEELTASLKASIKELYGIDYEPTFERPDEQFGDLTTNCAMQLSAKLNTSPRIIAEQIVASLSAAQPKHSFTIAGPGFINILIDPQILGQTIQQIVDQAESYGRSVVYWGKQVVAEYSDPNAFKAMHAGHLYTTLVGDSIANLLEHAGAEVHRVNFGGDVGLHVARAMWGIIDTLGGEFPEKLADIPEQNRTIWLGECYAKGYQAYETDEDTKSKIIALNKQIYQLHDQNDVTSSFAQIYWTCRAWSYEGFEKVYERLQVKSFEKYYPESATAPSGIKLAKQALKEGILENSDGAVVYKGEKDGLHTRVFLTKEGLPTYEAKDLGLLITKWEDFHFDLSFMITGNDIVEYMKVVQAVSRHFYPEITERSRHLTHGMILLPGGKKMSSRSGDILLADDILDAATAANIEQTGQDSFDTVLAAVKYAFLKQRVGGDIVYDPKESVNILGNSGPYLQYSYARAKSVLNKASKDPLPYQFDSSERSLVRKLSMYGESVERCIEELMPHHICTYLYELAQIFNSFYEHNRIIGDDREGQRLTLVKAYSQVLKNGLAVLGISAPEHM